MTIQEVKDYLNRTYQIDKQITSKIEQLELLIPTCNGGAISEDTPVQSSINLHSFENRVLNYMERAESLEKEIKELQAVKDEVMAKINLVTNTDERLVLEHRHVLCKSWEDIVTSMDLSKRHLLRIYDKALQTMCKVLEG